jgi:Kef-type K+ transport system membrane component KefB
MGHVPNFTATIFPVASMPALILVANLGLVFFLFIVGLEVDLRVMFRNFRVALSVSIAGMVLPFALGVAMAVGIYNTFAADSPISFGVYLLFIGVSFAITAFPVLARILTELKLLQTSVGIIVLSAGVGNDVTGWVLLALTVALVNAASGVTVVYVILLAIAMILLLCYVVRPIFIWGVNRSGGLQRGPSEMMMAVIVLLVLVVAFYTDIIGIHPIFGGFLVGLIIPHEHGYAVRVTEKIEDFIAVLFLPLVSNLSVAALTDLVLCVIGVENESWVVGYWDSLGLYNWDYSRCSIFQDFGEYNCCTIEWNGLA